MRSQTIVLLCSTLLAVAPAAAQQRMYKCVDARGKVYYTQVPPPECLGRDTQELDKSGTPMRKSQTPAALTPAQQKAREAELKKKLEAEERAKEERRKNTALLNTYSSAPSPKRKSGSPARRNAGRNWSRRRSSTSRNRCR